MRATYLVANVAKNAAAPLARRLAPGRGSYGMDGDPERVASMLDQIAPAVAAGGVAVPGATVLELGSGRTPEVAMALAVAGAREVVGVDPRPQIDDGWRATEPAETDHLVLARAASFVEAAQITDFDRSAARERISAHGWPVRFAATDGAHLPFEDSSVDLVVSKSTLEHVRRGDVPGLLAELARVVRPGGAMAHMIDLRDHMHIDGDDVHGDWLDALRYSTRTFELMFSRRSTSINRLRRRDWHAALARAGFEVLQDWPRRYPLADGWRRDRLAGPWRDLPAEELAVGQVLIASRRG